MKRLHAFCFTAIALLASSSATAKEPKPVQGVVVTIQDGELIIDVGQRQGLTKGSRVAIYRRLEVLHPATKKKIIDRFPIGEIALEQVGDVLSISRSYQKLSRAPQVGDFVVYSPVVSSPSPVVSGPSSIVVKSKSKAIDAQQAAVDNAFLASLGRPITERITIWEQYLVSNPKSRFVKDVAQELDWLRGRLDEERRLAEERAELGRSAKSRAAAELAQKADGKATAASRIAVDAKAPVVATFRNPHNVAEARVLARRVGAPTFQEVAMERVGDHNWRADLPADFTHEANDYEYFVEAVRIDGQIERTGETGIVQVYVPPADPAPVANRSTATVTGEYVDFKLGQGTDQYWRTEADYRYELGRVWLDGFRVGAGIFDGTGESVNAIAKGEASRNLSLGYGFAEVDFSTGRYVGSGIAILLGNKQGDDIKTLESSVGMRAFLRIGPKDGTQLQTGLALIGGLGSEAWINLDLLEIDRVPMKAEVVVTNLPVGEDLGVSLKAGAGYELFDGFSVLAHVGWNARTISHHGPGAGASLNIQW